MSGTRGCSVCGLDEWPVAWGWGGLVGQRAAAVRLGQMAGSLGLKVWPGGWVAGWLGRVLGARYKVEPSLP